jgi:hypothetical protein
VSYGTSVLLRYTFPRVIQTCGKREGELGHRVAEDVATIFETSLAKRSLTCEIFDDVFLDNRQSTRQGIALVSTMMTR